MTNERAKQANAASEVKKYLGIKDSDGKLATAAKIVLPIGAVSCAVDDINASKNRVAGLLDEVKERYAPKTGRLYSEIVVDLPMEIRAHNRRVAIRSAQAVLLLGLFIATISFLYFLSGSYWSLLSIPILVLIYIRAAQSVFIARALRDGRFSHKSVGAFMVDPKNLFWAVRLINE